MGQEQPYCQYDTNDGDHREWLPDDRGDVHFRDGGRNRKGTSTGRESEIECGVVATARVGGKERGFKL
jgi:hypothetical protein